MAQHVVFDEYGDMSVLRVEERDLVEPGPGQVRIRAEVIGVNPVDWKIVRGYLKDSFAMELPGTPGNEGAGRVSALGEGVENLQVGDPVVWSQFSGAYQSDPVVEARAVLRRPEGVSAEAAAVLPVAAGTAYAGLTQIALSSTDVLLVHGGAGGVGLAVVQIARHLGARVIATASSANHDFLRALGADPVSYGDGLAERVRAIATPSAVFDAAGGESNVAATRELVADLSRTVSAVPDSFTLDAGIPVVQHRPDELAAVLDLAAEGTLTLPVAARFSLREAREALELSESGHVRGKIVLLVE